MAAPARYGSEFLVNVTTDGGQDSPAVTGLANGNFVAVWESNGAGTNDAFARVYHADGTPLTGEIRVHASATGNQGTPVVAALTDGRFVVAWRDDAGGVLGFDIKARIYNGDGTPASGEFLVNTFNTASNQQEPAIAALAGGGFVISWTSSHLGTPDIMAKAFSATGSALGNEFALTTSAATESQSTVTGLTNGNYVIAWTDGSSVAGDTSGSHIEASIFSGNGVTTGLPQNFLVNTVVVAGDQREPSVIGLSDGTFVIAWTVPFGMELDIQGKYYSAVGAPGAAYPFENSGADESQPSLAALTNGQSALAWTDTRLVGTDISGSHISARIGVSGDEFVANTRSIDNQFEPAITALSDGRILIVWTNGGATAGAPDSAPNAVYAQIFDSRTAAVNLVGVGTLNNEWVGTSFGDAMDGAAGNDWIDGAGGNDNLFGGTGDDRLFGNAGGDTLDGGAANDALDGGAGADALKGGAGNDTYIVDVAGDVTTEGVNAGTDIVRSTVSRVLGANIENLTLAGSAAVSGSGNGLANIMIGNGARNGLSGGSGNDTLSSGAGNDSVRGGVGNDRLDGGTGIDLLQGDSGNDTMLGGTGVDKLIGGTGRDIMTGGSGRDKFDFDRVFDTGKTAGTRDIIKDFRHGQDKIDLSTIDANAGAAGNGRFVLLAAEGAAFTGIRGQLRWDQQNSSNNALDRTIISGDINGDARADFAIQLTGLKTLSAVDFVL